MPRQSQDYSWPFYAISGLLIRLAGIFLLARYEHISEHQLTLTDIDYKVYSDAGSYPSPYDRHTYRYPPIIAYINSYNYSHHETIGKILFALFDTVAIALLWRIFAGRQGQRAVDDARRVAKLYAFNPLFIYITVRGSCESVSMALMYAFWLLF